MKVLNLMTGGDIGGIETLCYNWSKKNYFENGYAFMTLGGPIYDQMREEGAKVYGLFRIGGKFSIKKLIHLIKIANQYETIIVHHDDPILKIYFIIIALILQCHRISFVHSCYGDNSQILYRKIKRKIYNWIFQKTFDISEHIIFVSNAGKESCKQIYHIDEKKCHVIYNGISDEILKGGFYNQVSMKKPYIISYIGRLNYIKGVDLLIQAVAILSRNYNIHLEIVGDGKERDTLEKIAKDVGIEELTSFKGRQLDVKPYLKKSNIFVYPSRCEEVFGISIVEAMAYGIPCVANKIGGIPEIIENGKNGFLSDEISVNGIMEAIKKVIICYENGLIDEMSNSAKKTAARFTIDINCKEVRNVLISY